MRALIGLPPVRPPPQPPSAAVAAKPPRGLRGRPQAFFEKSACSAPRRTFGTGCLAGLAPLRQKRMIQALGAVAKALGRAFARGRSGLRARLRRCWPSHLAHVMRSACVMIGTIFSSKARASLPQSSPRAFVCAQYMNGARNHRLCGPRGPLPAARARDGRRARQRLSRPFERAQQKPRAVSPASNQCII